MKHLLDIGELQAAQIEGLLSLAESFAETQNRSVRTVPALRNKTVVMAFFEDSTRTRTSFDLAARRLSAQVVNFSAGSSSLSKGESLRDTIETISAMGVDGIVVRHAASGVPHQITQWTEAAVINAGDGWHQHPTQALSDCFVARRHWGSIEGRHVAVCGDVAHSRVAGSTVAAFKALGAEVTLVAPTTLLPVALPEGVRVSHDLDEVVGDVDLLYLLRIQKERLAEPLVPSDAEYRTRFGLTSSRAKVLRPDALIMHPGPMNRGVEIDPDVADDSRSAVTQQVSAGIPVRMAVLYASLAVGRFEPKENA